MPDDVHGFEEAQPETPWCVQCASFLKWPYYDACVGCLTVGGRPAETVSFRTVHYDTAVLHAVIRRKVAVWEQRHPGWELAPDMQRYWEDSTHPSKYVDRETTIGRKLAWTRFRVERRHPRASLWRLGDAMERQEVPTLTRETSVDWDGRWQRSPIMVVTTAPTISARRSLLMAEEPKHPEPTQPDANPQAPASPGPSVPGEEPPGKPPEGVGEQQARQARERNRREAVPEGSREDEEEQKKKEPTA